MQNILMITETKGYLLMSIKEKFKAASYQVIIANADTDEINKIKESIDAILIYGDERMKEKQQPLNYLKDRAVEEDIPIFLVGDVEELEEMKIVIPKHMIRQEFLRPINVTELVGSIDTWIKKYGRLIKKKILVVDDSGAMLRNVKGWLEDKYNVILANSGAMAIKYLTLNRPDLVLLDYEMPVCDGKQVLEMIRSETEFTDIPVIFLTSKGDKESVMDVMALKPEGYLLKTMEPSLIVKTVDDFFVKKKLLY